MNKYDEFLNKVTAAVIEAVRKGGYTNVYITDELDTVVNNASKDVIEMGGTNIIYTIECSSYGDLDYENAEDFIEPDAEYNYIDDSQEELLKIYNKVNRIN